MFYNETLGNQIIISLYLLLIELSRKLRFIKSSTWMKYEQFFAYALFIYFLLFAHQPTFFSEVNKVLFHSEWHFTLIRLSFFFFINYPMLSFLSFFLRCFSIIGESRIEKNEKINVIHSSISHFQHYYLVFTFQLFPLQFNETPLAKFQALILYFHLNHCVIKK